MTRTLQLLLYYIQFMANNQEFNLFYYSFAFCFSFGLYRLHSIKLRSSSNGWIDVSVYIMLKCLCVPRILSILTMRRFFNDDDDDDNANLLFNLSKLRFFALPFFRRVLINNICGNGDDDDNDGYCDTDGADRFAMHTLFFRIDDAFDFVSYELSRRRRNVNLSIFDVFASKPSLIQMGE